MWLRNSNCCPVALPSKRTPIVWPDARLLLPTEVPRSVTALHHKRHDGDQPAPAMGAGADTY
jgi:hypothetical protein